MKLPAFQFYPGDWRKDPGVQALDYRERGIWIELLCLMHESERRGYLLLGGKPFPEDRLARTLGLTVEEITEVISTLISLGVAGLCPDTGAVISRRMIEDESRYEKFRESGKKGGNPNFKKGKKNPYYKPEDKGEDNPEDKPPDKGEDKQNITSSVSPSASTNNNPTPIRVRGGSAVLPHSFDELLKVAKAMVPTSEMRHLPDEGFCNWWWNEQEKRGWTDPQSGRVWFNWKNAFESAWQGHLHKKKENASRQPPPSGPMLNSSRVKPGQTPIAAPQRKLTAEDAI